MSGLVLAGLVVGGSVVTTAANAAEPDDGLSLEGLAIDSSIARAQTSKSSGTPVLATGSVTENGKPVEGAAIVARIWPNVDELAAVPEGASADVKIVDLAYADVDGNYSIELDPTLVPKTHIEEGGFLNVQLWAVHDGREVPWNFSAMVPGRSSQLGKATSGWTTQSLQAKNVSAPVDITFELGDSPNVKQSDDDAGEWLGSSGKTLAEEGKVGLTSRSAASLADGGVAVALAATTCWGAVPAGGTWYYDNRERFMIVWAWSGAKATVSQMNLSTP
ncbi:MAG: hypothetical protein EOO27_43295 [Comamonadaceae bacterium]|nr:MAG: hypothetical protein EOO27_43295 [Comamonadaceae bacterium]